MTQSLLELVLSEGVRAWPEVEIPPERVRTFLEERLPGSTGTTASRAADLYLACACLHGSPQALRHLDGMCRDELGFAIHRLKTDVDEHETVAALMAKLLVAEPGEKPKLAQYCGQSELHSWIQVVVARHILYEKRLLKHAEPFTEAILEELMASGSSEWQAMDPSTRRAFKGALAKALAALSAHDRNLLRYRLDGLSLAVIAEIYQVSFSTVSRWLARVGVVVKHAVLSDLRQSLRVPSAEMDSLVRSLLGQMNSSIRLEISRAFPDEQK